MLSGVWTASPLQAFPVLGTVRASGRLLFRFIFVEQLGSPRTYGWNRHSDPQRFCPAKSLPVTQKTFLVFQGIFSLNLLLAQIMKAGQRLLPSRWP